MFKKGLIFTTGTAILAGLIGVIYHVKKTFDEKEAENVKTDEQITDTPESEEEVENEAGEYGVDLNGDGIIDAIATDFDGDGTADKLEVDTDGDGKVDTVYTDTTGDGVLDTEVKLDEESKENAETENTTAERTEN